MKTLHLKIDPEHPDSDGSRAAIDAAASILRDGGLVAFPTETVYGLGANALDPEAVEKIFLAKQRPAWDPLIVHVSDSAMLSTVVAGESASTPSAGALAAAFWPGALTLLLAKADRVPPIVTASRPLVGVRMPAHPVAHALIARAGVPVAAPSANRFGRVSPTRAAHVLEDLDGRIDAILDGGETTHGVESTVVDASREPIMLYRPGVISIKQILEVCGSAIEWSASDETPAEPQSMPSPGLGLRHYAPRAKLALVGGDPAGQARELLRLARQAATDAGKVGILLPRGFLPSETTVLESEFLVFDWGDWNDAAELAHRLFAGLRALDAAGADWILCPVPSLEGIGAAIRDRLLKAAKSE